MKAPGGQRLDERREEGGRGRGRGVAAGGMLLEDVEVSYDSRETVQSHTWGHSPHSNLSPSAVGVVEEVRGKEERCGKLNLERKASSTCT
jgi:hypothetical protein